jgi:hypothetical protein
MATGCEIVTGEVHVGDVVVVYDEIEPADEAIAALVDALGRSPGLDAVGVLEPVTDAVKQVGPDGVVVATLDRSTLVTLGRPAAVRRTAWEGGNITTIGGV